MVNPIFAPGRTCSDLYCIARLDGRSAVAESYIALHRATRQRVLLTCSRFAHLQGDPPTGDAFLADVAKLRQLALDGIPRVLDAGIDGGVHWIAFDPSAIDAPLVHQVEADRRSRAARGEYRGAGNSNGLIDVITVGTWAASTLDAAFEQIGITHEDITPDRFRMAIRPDEVCPILLGLGEARIFRLTRPAALTNPRYRAPEQIAGEVATVRSDIYSLGMVLYEFIGRRPPYAERAILNDDSCLVSLAESELPARLPEDVCRPCVWAVLEQAIQKDPARRFSSWNEFKEALDHAERVTMGDPVPLVRSHPAERAPGTVPPGPITRSTIKRATEHAWSMLGAPTQGPDTESGGPPSGCGSAEPSSITESPAVAAAPTPRLPETPVWILAPRGPLSPRAAEEVRSPPPTGPYIVRIAAPTLIGGVRAPAPASVMDIDVDCDTDDAPAPPERVPEEAPSPDRPSYSPRSLWVALGIAGAFSGALVALLLVGPARRAADRAPMFPVLPQVVFVQAQPERVHDATDPRVPPTRKVAAPRARKSASAWSGACSSWAECGETTGSRQPQ